MSMLVAVNLLDTETSYKTTVVLVAVIVIVRVPWCQNHMVAVAVVVVVLVIVEVVSVLLAVSNCSSIAIAP